MGVYIPIRKVFEDEEAVIYEYGKGSVSLGKIRLSKSTGEMTLLDTSAAATEFVWSRAKRKLELHHANGEYPDNTAWAA